MGINFTHLPVTNITKSKKTRIAALDLIKLFSICGVLIVHLIGKTSYGGVFWYAQAVPIFMVLMGYNSSSTIKWKSLNKTYINYLIIYFISLSIALYKNIPFSFNFLPIGFLPYSGPGTYWILLYFLFILLSPLIHKLRRSMSIPSFLCLLFLLGWFFDLFYKPILEGMGEKIIYSSCPLRYILCFGLGMIIKEKSPIWFIKNMWWFTLLSILYLYIKNYTHIFIPYLFFENEGWNTGENGFAAFYPSMLVALILYILRGMPYNKIFTLGAFTYQIFLFQILWFPIRGITEINSALWVLLTFPCCFLGGYLLYKFSYKINYIINKNV